MAAATGNSIATSSGLQVAQKASNHDPSNHIGTANSQSDDDASSASDAQSDSSASDGSDSGSNADESTENIAIALPEAAPAPDEGSHDLEFATPNPPPLQGTSTTRDTLNLPSKAFDTSIGETETARTSSAVAAAPAESSAAVASSNRPLRAMPPSLPQNGRPIAPNGPAVNPYRSISKDITPGYRPKLLQPEDGRVTATIPHKLRGNLDAKSGRFATIHMDLPSTSRQERMSAAQRSSEATVAAANKANQAALAAQRSSEAVVAAAERASRAGYPRAKRQSAPTDGDVSGHHQPHPSPLTQGFPARLPLPHVTKTEQARLLTLLRAIHPNSIVDQLCKGLAYFGGIPGGPPPPNGAFPMSENCNGSGALFVNWLSEIFPPVYPAPAGYSPGQTPFPVRTSPGGSASQTLQLPSASQGHSDAAPKRIVHERPEAGPPIDTVILPRRKRGRPKGSKSSKPRKDKGIKKGPNPTRASTGLANAIGVGTNSANSETVVAGPTDPSDPQPAEAQHRENTTPNLTPTGKRRGRPPGSKNKPKPLPLGDMNTPIAQAAPVVHDEDGMYHRHTLPDESSPTAPRPTSLAQPRPLQSRQTQVQQAPEGVSAHTLPSPPAPGPTMAPASQPLASRKRKLSNSMGDQALHNNSGLSGGARQATSHAANSQVYTDPAQPQKRRRASNGVASQDRPAENSQSQPSTTSAPAVSPTVNPGGMSLASGSATPGSSFEGAPQVSRAAGTRQPGGGQHRMQQTASTVQKQQQHVRQGQNISPEAAQSLQRPAQQSGANVAPQTPLASSQQPARKPIAYSNSQQRPPQAPQNWQRSMVGPQQTANPDAQPVAQPPRYGVQPTEQRR